MTSLTKRRLLIAGGATMTLAAAIALTLMLVWSPTVVSPSAPASLSPATPPPAKDAVTFTVPPTTMAVDYPVFAGTGDVIMADIGDQEAEALEVSADGGRSWPRYLRGGLGEVRVAAGEGRLALYQGDADNPVSFPYPTKLKGGQWSPDWTLAALGTKAALSSDLHLVRVGQPNTTIRFASSPEPGSESYAFTSDSTYVARVVTTTGTKDYAALVEVSTGKQAGLVELPRTQQHQLSGSAIYSLTGTTDGLQLCRQPLPRGTARCTKVVTGDQSGSTATLDQFGSTALIRTNGEAAPIMVTADGTVAEVALPKGTVSWTRDGTGDPRLPLIRTVDGNDVPHHVRVQPDGTAAEYRPVTMDTAEVFSLTLSPTMLYTTLDPHSSFLDQQRQIGPSALGPAEKSWAIRAVSGSRWIVASANLQDYALYDQRKITVPLDQWAVDLTGPPSNDTLSGPYLLHGDQVQTADGRTVPTKKPLAIFGSLVAEQIDPPSGQSGIWVQVRDLAATAPATQFRLGDELPVTSRLLKVRMWGDWIASQTDRRQTRLINRKPAMS